MIAATGLPALAALAFGLLLFGIALAVRRWQRVPEAGGRRDAASLAGIAVQGAAFLLAWAGPVAVTLDPLSTTALVQAAATAALLAVALVLFVWATAAMGRNWSLVARTRDDHRLVTTGPFAVVRHPIYTALALVVVAVALAPGHVTHLVAALPVYALGTWLRVRAEERLLRAMFGTAYADYAARVKRFVPGLL